MKREFKVGDRVQYTGNTLNKRQTATKIGQTCVVRSEPNADGFVVVTFEDAPSFYTYTFNLQHLPKSYYINQFKKDYQKVNQ